LLGAAATADESDEMSLTYADSASGTSEESVNLDIFVSSFRGACGGTEMGNERECESKTDARTQNDTSRADIQNDCVAFPHREP
jgi:hypothetical protein